MDAEIKALRASLSNYGMTKLSNATDVIDVNSAALSVSENNPNVTGTLANKLSQLQIDLGRFKQFSVGAMPAYAEGKIETVQLDTYRVYILVTSQLAGRPQTNGLYMLISSEYAPRIYPIIVDSDSLSPEINLTTSGELSFTSRDTGEFAYVIYRVM